MRCINSPFTYLLTFAYGSRTTNFDKLASSKRTGKQASKVMPNNANSPMTNVAMLRRSAWTGFSQFFDRCAAAWR